MKVLHQIGSRDFGSNFNTLEEILACEEPITFDGIYESIYWFYKELKGKQITFFFSGKYLGGDNKFDYPQPLSKFCTWEQILEMAKYLGAGIGYHGWEHRSCKGLTRNELIAEMSPPAYLARLCDYADTPLTFAWPYGDFDKAALDVAEWLGYDLAYSVHHGDGSKFQLTRSHLNWG